MKRRQFIGGLTGAALAAGHRVRILYPGAPGPEAVAAQELARYIRELTGAAPALVDEARAGDTQGTTFTMLVGRTLATGRLLADGSLRDPAHLHPEAYLVRTVGNGPAAPLVFLGGTPIATLYAVYHYLQHCCGVGFFWDGDHMPRLPALPLAGIAIQARPHFDDRFYFNGCLHVYTAPWWEWEDWRRYIDWMVKSRFNVLDLSSSPGYNHLWQRVWRKFGVEIAPESWSGPPFDLHTSFGVEPSKTTGWREGRAVLQKKIVDYARSRGMRIVLPSLPGVVPPEFPRAHPNEKVLRTRWAEFPERLYLHPRSRMYHDVGKTFLAECVREFGTDHLYTLENYGELNLNEPEDLKRDIRREIVRANFRIVDEVDPRGIGLVNAWTFMGREWTTAMIREEVTGLPPDRIRVEDFYTEQHPFYKQTGYFFGLPWQYGVVHSYGGETHLHGHLPLLDKQVRSVAADPGASRCKAFMLMNEASGHNHFYFSFAARLSWNPAEVDLKTYTRDFARVRYGEAAAPMMVRALEELLGSVLGADDFAKPLYWRRLLGSSPLSVPRGAAFIPRLARALRFALDAREAAGANPLYLHDLNDIARQLLAELFNAGVLRLAAAFRGLDEDLFQKEAQGLDAVLASIENLLSADDYYWLSPQIRQASLLPGAPPDIDKRARNIVTVWGWAESLRDYACRDYLECVRWYYRPRVKAFIAELKLRMANGQREPDHGPGQTRLGKEYARIERDFVEKGFSPVTDKPDPRKVVERAAAALEYAAAGNHTPLPT